MTLVFEVLYVGFFVGVVGLCAAALLDVLKRNALATVGVVALVAVLGAAALVARTVQAGHLPIFGTFENTLTSGTGLVITAAVTSRRYRTTGSWAWAMPWTLGLLLYGTTFRREAVGLTISEQSLWVDAHVVFAWLAFVALVLASSLAMTRVTGRTFWGMCAEDSDEYVARLVNLGFLALSATMALGSWYLYVLFGVFWKWDIVETLMLAAWLGYGMVAHARYFYRLGGRALAWSVLGVLPFMFLSFWIWSVFPGTYHYFDIPLVRPY